MGFDRRDGLTMPFRLLVGFLVIHAWRGAFLDSWANRVGKRKVHEKETRCSERAFEFLNHNDVRD